MGRILTFFLLQTSQPEIQYFTLKDPNPEPSYVWFILNTFFFIGILLLVAFSIGIALGGFRYWLLAKFPHNRFNGVEEDDLAQTFRLND